jgi:hypothetical protein
MAMETFVPKRFNKSSVATIAQANTIINDYIAQGYSLTLRQLYYQFVARGLMENDQRNYKRLGSLLSKARLAGLVNWNALEDRTRSLKGWRGGYSDVASYMSGVDDGYFVDIWEGQPNYVEVWVEKEALVGVVERTCNRYRAQYFSCRGYSSQSEQYVAGKRFERQRRAGRRCHVLHLGDHDPSGMDMTRDNQDRLAMFSANSVEVKRLALNMDQVEELNPPPNPAKETDSRSGWYIDRYGESSWELDALDPSYINNLIEKEMKILVDIDKMNKRREYENEGTTEIRAVADNYDEIKEFLIDIGYL